MYAVLKDQVTIDGEEVSTLDMMNPPGTFHRGVRLRHWTSRNLLPMSGKLIPEFDRRQSIRDMFSRKPSLCTSQGFEGTFSGSNSVNVGLGIMLNPSAPMVGQLQQGQPAAVEPPAPADISASKNIPPVKRSHDETPLPAAKRAKSASQPSDPGENSKGQKSLKGFFQPKVTAKPALQSDGLDGAGEDQVTLSVMEKHQPMDTVTPVEATATGVSSQCPESSQQSDGSSVDPIVTKESWGKLFVKPAPPNCEHDEPCKVMLTKKSGINCGRSFWMCARHLGPSGNKERGTQWRCGTFIWASDWNGVG